MFGLTFTDILKSFLTMYAHIHVKNYKQAQTDSKICGIEQATKNYPQEATMPTNLD